MGRHRAESLDGGEMASGRNAIRTGVFELLQ
jgi:hypothetical protein